MASFHSSLWLVVFGCIYVPHLYPLLLQGTFGLFPSLVIVNSAAMDMGVRAEDLPNGAADKGDLQSHRITLMSVNQSVE